MDGLSATPGVIIIGATNRLDTIDPALRRPGRFDRELYFPLPCTSARKEILEIHLQMWAHKPSADFITYLADVTSGYNGSDLQALCSEAFLCCIKRVYPDVYTKINIDKQEMKVDECDFFSAKSNIIPWTQRNFTRMKKLSSYIQPLLQRQVDRILTQLCRVWPHFTTPGYNLICVRYCSRIMAKRLPANNERTKWSGRLRNRSVNDFSQVGGLGEHIRLLREIIILPLLHADLYSQFRVKSPQGVIFYGPPGTGKTLVAGALANELSKEGYGKVQFYNRKGADVLDKWVGESEKNLRKLFEEATKTRPSIIFFDELDGLAPIRSHRNDQIHCSIVTTLLGLMDGLSATPGVIIIGATNHLDAIDPALRRPGRFDRELYFPLPCASARREILEIHLQMWAHKPSADFITYLADVTSGYNGSDLQALCAEAFLCCIKRVHPDVYTKINIDKQEMKVDECDFFSAKSNIIPWTQRNFTRMKKLSSYIQPLLQRQVDRILTQLRRVWPHFTTPGYKFPVHLERYTGRLLLFGTNMQGLNMHILPALLHALEHLPVLELDAATIAEGKFQTYGDIPHILLLPRLGYLWDSIDDVCRHVLSMFLEDLHPSSPVLLICTSDTVIPEKLHHYFVNTTSIVCRIENPSTEERAEFFKPLYLGDNRLSVLKVLQGVCSQNRETENNKNYGGVNSKSNKYKLAMANRVKYTGPFRQHRKSRMCKSKSDESVLNSFKITKQSCLLEDKQQCIDSKQKNDSFVKVQSSLSIDSMCNLTNQKTSSVLYDKGSKLLKTNVNCRSRIEDVLHHVHKPTHHALSNYSNTFNKANSLKSVFTNLVNNTSFVYKHLEGPLSSERNVKQNTSTSSTSGCLDDVKIDIVKDLFNHIVYVTSESYSVSQLELLYDSLSASLYMYKNNFDRLVKHLQNTVSSFENEYCDYT